MHYPNYDKRYYQSVQDVLDIKFRMISVKKLNKNYTAVNKEKGDGKSFLFLITCISQVEGLTDNNSSCKI